MPDRDFPKGKEACKQEGTAHLNQLRADQQAAPVHAVGDDAAYE